MSFHTASVISGQTITGRNPSLSAVTPLVNKMLRCRDCPLSAISGHCNDHASLGVEPTSSVQTIIGRSVMVRADGTIEVSEVEAQWLYCQGFQKA
jgi:hypothetical protein